MNQPETVVGIDLGTTNSEIAAFHEGRVRVLGPGGGILPSCVGLSPDGELLVGEAARNQQRLYPERTVRSIKRRMGKNEKVAVGERELTPPEVSSLILRELAEWARRTLACEIRKAVITVPAYFSDAQRIATREAGALAGLEVVRILNEPTAASLAYGSGDGGRRTVLVYDLGGGTFDVSVVRTEDDVTEVLSSHGNNHLGGDDFDNLLAAHLMRRFQEVHGVDLRDGHAAARARLWWAAEEAKLKLSAEPAARILEEALVVRQGKPLHLDLEISRDEYEEMIFPLVESTLDSVGKTLTDAGLRAADLDAILLVGGSTRTPLVSRLLREKCGSDPRQDVHPDLAVALGAGVLAARLGGREVDRVLVDVSPYSFGPSYLGLRDGMPYAHCYHPIIRRNTPLPVTRTDGYCTAMPFQERIEVDIFQGDEDDALKNLLVGQFHFDGLRRVEENNEILCRMSLDIDGILHVTATEKATGKSVHVTIENATANRSEAELTEARRRMDALYEQRGEWTDEWMNGLWDGAPESTVDVGGRSRPDRDSAAGLGERDGPDAESADEFPDRNRPDAATAGTDRRADGAGAPSVEQPAPEAAWMAEARAVVERSRRLLDRMHSDDVQEAVTLHERIAAGLATGDAPTVAEARQALEELLFFVEGA